MLFVKSGWQVGCLPRAEILLLLNYIYHRTHVQYSSVIEVLGDCFHR